MIRILPQRSHAPGPSLELPEIVAGAVPTPVVRLPPPAYTSARSGPRTARVRDPDDLTPIPAATVLVRKHRPSPVSWYWRCTVLACPTGHEDGTRSRQVVDIAPLDRQPRSRHHDAGHLICDLYRRLRARRVRRARLVRPHRGRHRGSLKRGLRPAMNGEASKQQTNRSTTLTKPGTLITAANTAEAIKSRSTRESANGALDDECEDKSTGESVNGALNNEWRSETQKMKLQGQKLQKQQNRMRRQIRPVRTFLAPHPESK